MKRLVEAGPLTRWTFIGIGASLLVLPVAFQALGLVTQTYSLTEADPPRPPEPLDLPWVWGLAGWAFLILCASITALALWLDRKSDRRVEPLAAIALCLAVLGHAQAISGARVISNNPYSWPLNLVGVSIWILIAATGAGAIAWVRILISKRPVRGRVFATCALVCSLCTAWIVDRFLVDYGLATTLNGGIELPLSVHSTLDRPDPDEYRPEIIILADGSTSHEPLASLAQKMQQQDGFPCEPILIRADRRASWSAVSRVIGEAQEAKIWKLMFSTRWEQPAVETKLAAFLPKEIDVSFDGAAIELPPHVLRVSAEGVFQFDDETFDDRAALCDRLDRLSGERGNRDVIRIEPDAEARWGRVVDTLTAALHASHLIQLGPFDLWMN